jgi:cytochrome c oxidase subunit 2
VQKGWSIFFGVVILATFLIWFVAPSYGWWLPENVSSFGGGVDILFYVILGLTTFFFVLTEIVLVYGMWQFASPVAEPQADDRAGPKAVYTHGNHRLEVLWTAVPAVILLGIAVVQIRVWENIKYQSRMPSPNLTVAVQARQWEWRMRYASDNSRFAFDPEGGKEAIAKAHLIGRGWAEHPEIDDTHATNELHAWKEADVKIWLRTVDVLHSFTLPNLRLKQDTLPGKTIPMWFRSTKSNCRFVLKDRTRGREIPVVLDDETKEIKVRLPGSEEAVPLTGKLTNLRGELITSGNKRDAWEIACQELCGGRHYAMRGRLYVHEDMKSYYTWLRWTHTQQQSRTQDSPVALGQ